MFCIQPGSNQLRSILIVDATNIQIPIFIRRMAGNVADRLSARSYWFDNAKFNVRLAIDVFFVLDCSSVEFGCALSISFCQAVDKILRGILILHLTATATNYNILQL